MDWQHVVSLNRLKKMETDELCFIYSKSKDRCITYNKPKVCGGNVILFNFKLFNKSKLDFDDEIQNREE